MAHKKSPSQKMQHKASYQMPVLVLGALSVVTSFGIGIKTAGDVQTIQPTSANEVRLAGDMNMDGVIDKKDVIIILEIAQGYQEATPEQLLADPNSDGNLTIDDAVRMLYDIQ